MKHLYYCPSCKLRFQQQNFGYGYPRLNQGGNALCPHCQTPMEATSGRSFPVEWIEERPHVDHEVDLSEPATI